MLKINSKQIKDLNKLQKEQIKILTKFVQIGSLVFLIDYILFQVFVNFLNIIFSRILSYTFCTWIAWNFNRIYTFSNKTGTFINYYFVALAAGIQNVTISNGLMILLGSDYIKSFLFIGIGSIYGLIFNYIFQSKITFKNFKL